MIAKVINDENGQFIELPKELVIDEKEVEVKKIGQALILMPAGTNWEVLQTVQNQISKDFMSEGRAEDVPQERDFSCWD